MLAVQCKMARVALGLGVRDLAERAAVSPNTIARLERGEELREQTLTTIRAALETAGIEFIEENGGGAGVRLRKASATKGPAVSDEAALPAKLKNDEPYDGSPV